VGPVTGFIRRFFNFLALRFAQECGVFCLIMSAGILAWAVFFLFVVEFGSSLQAASAQLWFDKIYFIGGIIMARRKKSIYKRKDGRYEARYVCSLGADGSKKYRSVYGRDCGEVEAKLAAAVQARGVLCYEAPETVGAILEAHISRMQATGKASTLALYRGYLRRYIAPRLGAVRCYRLTAEQLREFVNALLAAGLAALPWPPFSPS
jgi:hypothetical protein